VALWQKIAGSPNRIVRNPIGRPQIEVLKSHSSPFSLFVPGCGRTWPRTGQFLGGGGTFRDQRQSWWHHWKIFDIIKVMHDGNIWPRYWSQYATKLDSVWTYMTGKTSTRVLTSEVKIGPLLTLDWPKKFCFWTRGKWLFLLLNYSCNLAVTSIPCNGVCNVAHSVVFLVLKIAFGK
jgi:hypothetical protein